MRCVLVFLLLVSCSSKPKMTHFNGEVMTMPFHIQVGRALSKSEEKRVLELINQTFSDIDLTFNHWNPASELSSLNNLPAKTPVKLSPELYTLLHLAKEVTLLSENRYDPTAGKLITLWKRALKQGKTPQQEKLDELSIGWEHFQLEWEQVIKEVAEIAIDLDGIVKGHGVDLLIERLSHHGFLDLYVEWAGEIRVLGKHPQGRSWKVQLDGGEIISLENQAIATSGSLVQSYELDEVYTHIIDPQTKRALVITDEAPTSVTVIASSCAMADALATAGMLFDSRDEARMWADSIKKQLNINIIIK